jgi:hypothetical protein
VAIGGVRGAETADAAVRGGVASVRSMRAYAERRVAQGDRLAALVDEGLLPADLRIATAGAGALPYRSGLYTVDVLGLNDRTVALSAAPRPGARKGHEKRAWRGYLAERGVDMLDVAGGFVFRRDRPSAAVHGRANRRLQRFNRTRGDAALKLRCREVPGGHLLFASPLGDAAFEDRFGHLPECRGRARPAVSRVPPPA